MDLTNEQKDALAALRIRTESIFGALPNLISIEFLMREQIAPQIYLLAEGKIVAKTGLIWLLRTILCETSNIGELRTKSDTVFSAVNTYNNGNGIVGHITPLLREYLFDVGYMTMASYIRVLVKAFPKDKLARAYILVPRHLGCRLSLDYRRPDMNSVYITRTTCIKYGFPWGKADNKIDLDPKIIAYLSWDEYERRR